MGVRAGVVGVVENNYIKRIIPSLKIKVKSKKIRSDSINICRGIYLIILILMERGGGGGGGVERRAGWGGGWGGGSRKITRTRQQQNNYYTQLCWFSRFQGRSR